MRFHHTWAAIQKGPEKKFSERPFGRQTKKYKLSEQPVCCIPVSTVKPWQTNLNPPVQNETNLGRR